eukprot:3174925-Ditylum_brightwellii.AAC.1
MADTRCSYTSCLEVYPHTMMETCQAPGCKGKLHHLCKIELELMQKFNDGLRKRSMSCILLAVQVSLIENIGNGVTTRAGVGRSQSTSSTMLGADGNAYLQVQVAINSYIAAIPNVKPNYRTGNTSQANESNSTPRASNKTNALCGETSGDDANRNANTTNHLYK